LNIDKEPGEQIAIEKIVAINQHPLPTREGFWNNQCIPVEGDIFTVQNMKLGDVYYGSAVGHRKILRFGGGEKKDWTQLNWKRKNNNFESEYIFLRKQNLYSEKNLWKQNLDAYS